MSDREVPAYKSRDATAWSWGSEAWVAMETPKMLHLWRHQASIKESYTQGVDPSQAREACYRQQRRKGRAADTFWNQTWQQDLEVCLSPTPKILGGCISRNLYKMEHNRRKLQSWKCAFEGDTGNQPTFVPWMVRDSNFFCNVLLPWYTALSYA